MEYVKDLTRLFVSDTFPRLLQISASDSGNIILDGTGSVVELVVSASNLYVSGAISCTLDDGTTGVTQLPQDNSTKIATTEYVDTAVLGEDFWDKSGSILYPRIPTDSLYISESIIGSILYISESAYFDRYADFNSAYYIDTIPPYEEGRVFYDKRYNSLAYYNEVEDVAVNIGLETLIRVRNNTKSDILDGTPVIITGGVGNLVTIATASCTSAEEAKVIGLATHRIERNSNGYVTVSGGVHNLNTSYFSDGDRLFLSSSGQMTNVQLSPPYYSIEIGFCLNAHTNLGIISVSPSPTDVTGNMIINTANFINGLTGSLQGNILRNNVEVSNSYDLLTTDYYVDVNTSENSCSIQLFDASDVNAGWDCNIGDISFSASIHSVSIIASGSQKINNSKSASFDGDGNAITVKSNGVNQFFIR